MNIVVPQLGESVIEARVARWLKKAGDAVSQGDPLVELETDKIDLEVNADASGVLSRIDRQEGEDVKVGEGLRPRRHKRSGRPRRRRRWPPTSASICRRFRPPAKADG
jgi:multidrug efflux pump subunit AcrA (membrane-fusion protein)